MGLVISVMDIAPLQASSRTYSVHLEKDCDLLSLSYWRCRYSVTVYGIIFVRININIKLSLVLKGVIMNISILVQKMKLFHNLFKIYSMFLFDIFCLPIFAMCHYSIMIWNYLTLLWCMHSSSSAYRFDDLVFHYLWSFNWTRVPLIQLHRCNLCYVNRLVLQVAVLNPTWWLI